MVHCSIKFIIISILLLASKISYAEKLYYEDQDLQKFFQRYSLISEPIDPHAQKILAIQVSFIVSKNKIKYQEILDNLNSIPKTIRVPVVQGLVNAYGGNIEANQSYNLTPYPLVEEINSLNFTLPSNNNKDQQQNMLAADYLWAAFYVTGNQDYLVRIVTFLSQFSTKIRAISQEIKNREIIDNVTSKLGVSSKTESLDSLVKTLTMKEKFEIISYDIVSWSLESNRKSFPAIDISVKEIFTKRPKLNFYQDVKL